MSDVIGKLKFIPLYSFLWLLFWMVCLAMCVRVCVPMSMCRPEVNLECYSSQALQLVSCSPVGREFTWVGLVRWPLSLGECSVFTYPDYKHVLSYWLLHMSSRNWTQVSCLAFPTELSPQPCSFIFIMRSTWHTSNKSIFSLSKCLIPPWR